MLIILHKFNTLVLIMLPFPLILSGGADYVPFMEVISLTDVSPGRQTSLTITIIDDNDFETDEIFFSFLIHQVLEFWLTIPWLLLSLWMMMVNITPL